MIEMVIDTSKVMGTLRNLEKNLTSQEHKRASARAARKGGNLLKSKVRSALPNSDKYPYVDYVRRAIVVKNSKAYNKYPGVNITIKKGEVPVSPGAGRDWWDIRGYAYLVMFGNYMNPNRTGRGGKNRGNVRGITQKNIFESVRKRYGTPALRIMNTLMKVEVQKEISKSVVR